MVYRYSYGNLLDSKTTDTNFKPLSQVIGSEGSDFRNMATALLEQKGLIAGDVTDSFMANAVANAGGSTSQALQNIANLTESDTAETRGDKWGGSDNTMGRSFFEAIVAGETSDVSIADLYTKGFGREADEGGLKYWQSQLETQGLQSIAQSFLSSEEASLRDLYHKHYGRDADQSGLDYWLNHTGDDSGPSDHNTYDATEMLDRILSDKNTPETSVRSLLSEQLGIHSSDTQRASDGVFTDASEEDVYRMMASDDLGQSEVAAKVKMQTAAKSMADYGLGAQDQGATNIHRILSSAEMGEVAERGSDTVAGLHKGDWVANQETLAKTATDYNPTITNFGNIPLPLQDGASANEQNVWSLVQPGTQNYSNDPLSQTQVGGEGDDATVDYTPELSSNIPDLSSYGDSKSTFDERAEDVNIPITDVQGIRSSTFSTAGKSAKGVRMKRSKKFKSGESTLGTQQLGRKLQIKSLNV